MNPFAIDTTNGAKKDYVKYFSAAHSKYADVFPAEADDFKEMMKNLIGVESTSGKVVGDIQKAFEELFAIRRKSTAHTRGGHVHNFSDACWTFSTVVMAAFVIAQQARKWADLRLSAAGAGMMYLPSAAACNTLIMQAEAKLSLVLE